MKKVLIAVIALGLAPLLYAEDTSAVQAKEKVQVQNKKNNMALEKQLGIMEKNLAKKGVGEQDRKTARDAVKNMYENEGYSPIQARNLVSETALECHKLGIKGNELAAKIHEAIQERKQERALGKAEKKQQNQTRSEMRENKRMQDRGESAQSGSGTGTCPTDGSGRQGGGSDSGQGQQGGDGSGIGQQQDGGTQNQKGKN